MSVTFESFSGTRAVQLRFFFILTVALYRCVYLGEIKQPGMDQSVRISLPSLLLVGFCLTPWQS